MSLAVDVVATEPVLPNGDTDALRPGDVVQQDQTTQTPETAADKPQSDLDKLRAAEQKAAAKALKRLQAKYEMEMQALQKRLEETETRQAIQDAEASLYAQYRRQGHDHATAMSYAKEDARAHIEQTRASRQREAELETYRTREERADALAAQVRSKKELREDYGLSHSDLDRILEDLDPDDPNWQQKATKLCRAYEKQQRAQQSTQANRDLRNGLPMPPAGTGATADDVLTPPKDVPMWAPEYGEYLAKKRAFIREQQRRGGS